jgi:cation diffusion facilitator CzcD-associated flavoprotein CzcO
MFADIPAHTYQATFEPNKEWSTFYAAAPEIHAYWKRVAEKYGCMKYIKLKQAVVEAVWDDSKSKWQLKVGTPSPVC